MVWYQNVVFNYAFGLVFDWQFVMCQRAVGRRPPGKESRPSQERGEGEISRMFESCPPWHFRPDIGSSQIATPPRISGTYAKRSIKLAALGETERDSHPVVAYLIVARCIKSLLFDLPFRQNAEEPLPLGPEWPTQLGARSRDFWTKWVRETPDAATSETSSLLTIFLEATRPERQSRSTNRLINIRVFMTCLTTAENRAFLPNFIK